MKKLGKNVITMKNHKKEGEFLTNKKFIALYSLIFVMIRYLMKLYFINESNQLSWLLSLAPILCIIFIFRLLCYKYNIDENLNSEKEIFNMATCVIILFITIFIFKNDILNGNSFAIHLVFFMFNIFCLFFSLNSISKNCINNRHNE